MAFPEEIFRDVRILQKGCPLEFVCEEVISTQLSEGILKKEFCRSSLRCFIFDIFDQSSTKKEIVLTTSLPDRVSEWNRRLFHSFDNVQQNIADSISEDVCRFDILCASLQLCQSSDRFSGGVGEPQRCRMTSHTDLGKLQFRMRWSEFSSWL